MGAVERQITERMEALETVAREEREAAEREEDEGYDKEAGRERGAVDGTATSRKDYGKLLGRLFAKDYVDVLPIVAMLEALEYAAEVEVVSNGKVAQLGYSLQGSNGIPLNHSEVEKNLGADISPSNAFQEDTRVIEGAGGITGTKTLIGQLSLSEEFI